MRRVPRRHFELPACGWRQRRHHHRNVVHGSRLAQRRNAQGQPLLLADEIGAQGRNLSFEREFGKIIARLDLLAAFTTEKYRRAAISYVQGIVGGTFLQFLPVR